jgi:hypothetical protein
MQTEAQFASFTSAAFVVTEEQAYVRPTDLIAAEQIKSEEKQPLIGAIPKFHTGYIYDAAPLIWKPKFSLAARGHIRSGFHDPRIPLEAVDDERPGLWKTMNISDYIYQACGLLSSSPLIGQ